MCCDGGGGSSAPAADPNIGRAAIMQAQTGNDMLDFMKSSYADAMTRQDKTDALSEEVTRQQLGTSKQQVQWATEDRARYQSVFQPLQDKYIQTANNWDSADRLASVASEARGSVMSNAALAKQQTDRGLAAAGVRPDSGRAAGIDRAADLTAGLTAAGAENNARSQARTQAVAMRESAINLGNGLPATAAQASTTGLQAGTAAMGTNLSANNQFLTSQNLMTQGFQGAMQGYQGMGSTLNQKYSTDVSAWSAGQQAAAQSSAGMGSALGSIAGLGMAAMMM